MSVSREILSAVRSRRRPRRTVVDVPAISGCATQGDSFEEFLSNLHEAVEGCLSVDVRDVPTSPDDRVVEIAV